MSETLLTSQRGGVTTFMINRPHVRNAVDGPTSVTGKLLKRELRVAEQPAA